MRRAEGESNSRVNSAAADTPTVAVMVDDDGKGDEDDDLFVVVDQTTAPTPTQDVIAVAAEGEDDGEHGMLMRKIQEKKGLGHELQQEGGAIDATDRDSDVSEAARKRDHEQAVKETERLREDIQALCQSANPLGKIVDYIQEDVDAMRKEMLQWKEEHAENTLKLSEEAAATEDELQPIRVQLDDLEQQIKDQEELIAAAKVSVKEADTRVNQMLESVAFASRN
jgi:TRAF3-interacting protein 1